MMKNNRRYVHNSFFFIIFTCAGTVLLAVALFLRFDHTPVPFLEFEAAGILLIGIGEWINHPRRTSLAPVNSEGTAFDRVDHRKRTPSILGNLVEICGLLFLFTGLSYLL